ncbi:ABC transporter substrate binding protein [Neptunomonas sp. XY-337]|uniref:ABC transporter substrate binding protein n=1 Tax=Neptunomonas sp. XY-337 TaxID=2561897 RepID=UPI0010AA706E|nr:ABC transporter substrate binding protein [Neptunomonas sp. XY-337]
MHRVVSRRWMDLFVSVIAVFSVVVSTLLSANTSGTTQFKDQRILLIYSYHPTFPTARRVYEGVLAGFPKDNHPRIDIEFMDSKRHVDDEYQKLFLASLTYKLSQRAPYDLVMAVDDNAFNLVRSVKDELFADVPIVFLGVNNRKSALMANNEPNVTGVVEAASIAGTIHLAGALQPEMEHLHVIVDGTPSGQADLQTLLELASQFPDKTINVLSLAEMSWAELSNALPYINTQDAILLLSAYRDNTQKQLSFDDALKLILAKAPVPIFHLWEHGLGDGILGGLIISHFEQGKKAAQAARYILSGTSPATIPVVTESPNITVVDDRAMQRFGLNYAALPESAQIRFKRSSLFERYAVELSIVGLIFLLMAILIAYLIRQNQLRAKLTRTLAEQEHTLRSILDNLDACVYLKDMNGHYVFANAAVREVFQVPLEHVVGCDDYAFFSPLTAKEITQNDKTVLESGQTLRVEEVNTSKDGGLTRTYRTTKLPLKNEQGHVFALCGISVDVTEQKQYEEQLKFMAHYDQLTKLPNRLLFSDRLQQAILQCHRNNEVLAVIYIDLDGFKDINDRYGHETGDLLLKEIALTGHHILREQDTFARLGGDEFVAVLVDIQEQARAIEIAKRLIKLMATPFYISEKLLKISASIGITIYPQEEPLDADQLLRQADQAMYAAKTKGKNRYHCFDSQIEKHIIQREQRLDRIQKAIRAGELVLYYQPKVNMATGEVIGLEALVRWLHPEHGLLPPGDFLPLIEGHSLSIELGDWVIAQALEQLDHWYKQGLELSVSVNVSNMQLEHGRFVEKLRTQLGYYTNLPNNLLQLEILETGALENTSFVSATMNECQQMGLEFALDDFGTAYSSLSHLKKLPAAYLKIDRGFVKDILVDADDRAILDGVISLANAFQMKLIAEGIESVEHGTALLELGCQLAQGYAIARPMPAADIAEWLRMWKQPAAWRQATVSTAKEDHIV